MNEIEIAIIKYYLSMVISNYEKSIESEMFKYIQRAYVSILEMLESGQGEVKVIATNIMKLFNISSNIDNDESQAINSLLIDLLAMETRVKRACEHIDDIGYFILQRYGKTIA